MPGFLAIDPGETTGWALFDQLGQLLELGQIQGFEAFQVWLGTIPKPDLIVCEDYLVDPRTPHGGSNLPTVQIIGLVREYANENGIVRILQSRTYLRIGYAWAGIRPLPKSKHSESHQFDAMAHGVYYLVKHGIRKVAMRKRHS